MTIEQAIKKAIEGGWKSKNTINGTLVKPSTAEAELIVNGTMSLAWFLDPSFWQSLGNGSLTASYAGSACRFRGMSAGRLQFDRILVVRLGRKSDGNSGAPRIRVLMTELDYSKKGYII